MILKKKILEFRTGRNLKKHSADPMRSFTACEKIGILFSEQFEPDDTIDNLIIDLKVFGKEVDALAFCPNRNQISTTFGHFTAEDLSMTGEVLNDRLKFFLKQHFDFVLCLDDSGHFVLNYVLSLVHARCRIGISMPERTRFFDMIIDCGENGKDRGARMLNYLKMIRHEAS